MQTKASKIMLKVLAGDDEHAYAKQVNNCSNHYLVIMGNKEPRWILPVNPLYGRKVLAQWRPYNLISRLKWIVVRFLYASNLLAKMPGVVSLTCTVDGLKIPIGNIPVVYIGTPGSQQKAVVTLVDSTTGTLLTIMKVALGENASKSLFRESKILQMLDHADVKNVPKLIEKKPENDRAWQTIVSGVLSARSLTSAHINCLLSLPMSSKATSFNLQKKILQQLISNDFNQLSAQHLEIVSKGVHHIRGEDEIPLVFIHGDFAPWNIKQVSANELAIIDWEDAEPEGLPLWDLCHFYFIQVHLFDNNVNANQFFSTPLIEDYLNAINIGSKNKHMLILLYLLRKAVDNNAAISHEYRAFVVSQIPLFYEN